MTTSIHAPSTSPEWWRSAVIYQIYPRSFADASGDGIGDLPGIISKLPYLADLGVDAIWLSPFYRSPQKDAGYDVSDYRDVDPMFGTLDDADVLIERAHELGLKVIVDLVPNHTSDQHKWFQQALAAAPGSPERARYMFADGKGPDGAEPPNNWKSIFGGPGWTRLTGPDGQPEQWYLHMFDTSQPDLNWENLEVRAEFADTIRFWLGRGVDGIRVDVANALVKEPGLPDWDGPMANLGTARPPMFDQEGVHDIYREWRRVFDEFEDESKPGRDRFLVAEAWVEDFNRLARYLRPDEMQQAFNFVFLDAKRDPATYRKVITDSLAACDSVGAPATWVLSNHDVVRHASRFGLPVSDDKSFGLPQGVGPNDPQPDAALGLRRARAATTFMLALPGSAYIYQGEELGLPEHTTLPDEARDDPTFFRTGGESVGRDGCRVPLPWTAEGESFGYSPTGKAWLPQPPEWRAYAADAQEGDRASTLELYRSLLRLRKEHQLGAGGFEWVDGFGPQVLAFRTGDVTVLSNFGPDPVRLPADAQVVISSEQLPADGTLPADTTVWIEN